MLARCTLLFALLLVASGARAAADVRILVVDLQPKGGVLPDQAEIVTGLVTARLQRYPKVAVVSGADIREMIALEAQKQTTGCDDASCLSEVAGALGAELLVTGTLGRLGEQYIVTLNLIDVTKASAVARATAEMNDLSDAPAKLRPAVDRLVAPMRARVGDVVEEELGFFALADRALTWTGWGMAAAGAVSLLVEQGVFLIAYFGLAARPIDTAFIPLCGPFAVFLNESTVSRDPNNAEDIETLGIGCCLCELASCGLCLLAPAVLGGGAVLGLFDSEESDAAAAARFGPPAAPSLDDDERQRLAAQMPY